MNLTYSCSQCGRIYRITPDIMLCPDCSKRQEKDRPLRGILEVNLENPQAVSSNNSNDSLTTDNHDISKTLPVENKFFPPVPVGNTPLWEPDNLRNLLGYPNLFLKDDSLNPTGSFKDRASFLVAAFARQHGIDRITVASTGNAASSMAGIGAAAGLGVTVYVPEKAPPAKIVQARQYGAEVITVEGGYDKAYELSLNHISRKGGLSRNTAYNPLTVEGKKTAAFEIFEQLDQVLPDSIFLPAGDGTILGGIYRGLENLRQLGLTDAIPTLWAVQAEGSCAIAEALARGDFTGPTAPDTIADSISVAVPRCGYYALQKLKKHGGRCIKVSDLEILEAQRLLASVAGLFAEPAAAASLAGMIKVRDLLPATSSIVLLITGSGLKDIDAADRGLAMIRAGGHSYSGIRFSR